jgi:hypothetical protein
MNAVIERLQAQRDEQLQFVGQMLDRVDAEGRDLVEAERNNVAAARQRVAEIDAQLAPLVEFDALRSAASNGQPLPGRTRSATTEPRPLDPSGNQAPGGGLPWRTAGAFVVDHLRARGLRWAGQAGAPDAAAAARIERAVANQITTDTPGLLPQPVVGPIVGALEASRPFVTSVGVKDMGGIPGSQFSRPRITQHTAVGKQAAEKTAVASQPMKIMPVPFVKETYGGSVDISRQDIDWTSPAAWDALIQDLADVYGAQTEIAAATSFAAAITQTAAAPATDDLAGWTAALYEAASLAFQGGAAVGAIPMGKLPNHIWVSMDMWGHLGSIVDVARLATFANAAQAFGAGDPTTFVGDVLNMPRSVVWAFPPKTVIVGNTAMYEFYEEIIGLLSAVEPSLLGIEVAYGGYTAYSALEPLAFAKIAPPVIPFAAGRSAK